MEITKLSQTGEIYTLDNEIVNTHFISKNRQLFESKDKSFAYKKDEGALYQFEERRYFLLLLKLGSLRSLIKENIDCNYTRKIN